LVAARIAEILWSICASAGSFMSELLLQFDFVGGEPNDIFSRQLVDYLNVFFFVGHIN
jgi:hypothetical protein